MTQALAAAGPCGQVRRGGPLLFVEGRAAILRSRSAVASATLRRPEMLPPAEIEAAVLGVVAASPGANDEQAVQAEIDALPPRP